jgi:uncharacterized OB-fold protein
MTAAVPRPKRTLATGEDRAFWDWCAKGELRIQRCECGKLEWPPVAACSRCRGTNLVWTRMSGRGRLRSYCRFERQYYPECPPPWTVILVELDEGPIFISDPDGVPEGDLQDGVELRVRFIAARDEAGEFALPVFGRA